MVSQRVKLQRRVGELKEELSRESSMRASLEESHKSLLQRITDMESTVEAERGEVCTTDDSDLMKLDVNVM